MTHLVWFRRDLRILDNPALYYACQKSNEAVIALYLLTPDFWQRHHDANCKIAFWLRNLACLEAELKKLNISLFVSVVTQKNIKSVFKKISQQYRITHLHFNTLLEPDEYRIDLAITKLCEKLSIKVHHYQQTCILEPGAVVKANNKPYQIFTPFKNKWLSVLKPDDYICLPKPKLKHYIVKLEKTTTLKNFLHQYKKEDFPQWSAGEYTAQQRLREFTSHHIKEYANTRDFPALSGTSQLSPYLTAGVLSVRQCLATAVQLQQNKGIKTWINELIWRDFYQHILYFFPHVGKNRAFKRETEKIVWHKNQHHFQAWCEGRTGIPIIDAAMRQLLQTGWMHNRLRMVVTMFFSKNLFLDWRNGEQYFMQHLIDGDLAANNGGWQWSASAGTDAVPYFRIFNPYRQSQRFDPEGCFIRQYCPELAALDHKQIHQPPLLKDYPEPIVNVELTRKQAIAMFKKALKE